MKADSMLGSHAWIAAYIKSSNTQTISIFASIGERLLPDASCSDNLRSAAFVMIMTRIALFCKIKAIPKRICSRSASRQSTEQSRQQDQMNNWVEHMVFPDNVLCLESNVITFVPLSQWNSVDRNQAISFLNYWGTFEYAVYDQLVPCFSLF
jgi:hypothetical protein